MITQAEIDMTITMVMVKTEIETEIVTETEIEIVIEIEIEIVIEMVIEAIIVTTLMISEIPTILTIDMIAMPIILLLHNITTTITLHNPIQEMVTCSNTTTLLHTITPIQNLQMATLLSSHPTITTDILPAIINVERIYNMENPKSCLFDFF